MKKNGTYGIKFDENGNIAKEKNILERQSTIVYEIYHILHDENFSNETRYKLVSELVRDWTSLRAVNGKSRNIPLWSENAFAKYEEIEKEKGGALDAISEELKKHVIHEHILPVKACVKFFDTFGPYLPDEEFVKEVMYNKLYAAVVTKDENIILNDRYKDSMPDSFYETDNIFDRYAEVEIPLKRIVWKEKARGIKSTKVIDQELTPLENEFKIIFDDNTDVATNGILDAFKLR